MEPPDTAVLREYAMLADGCRGILVGPNGEMAWGCFPGWDGGAVFAALLGGDGWWTLTPRGRHTWGGSYEHGTLIWRSRWVGSDAIVESREALNYPGCMDTATIMRRVTCGRGEAVVDLRLMPRAEYGEARPTRVKRRDDGSWSGRLGPHYFRWSGASGARYDERSGAFLATIRVRPEHSIDLILELSTQPPKDSMLTADQLWEGTQEGWRRCVPDLSVPIANRDVRQACAVLRGMTTPSGAMVAAATASLPERPGGRRDYDYRYAWIRDQCFAGIAAAAAGLDEMVVEGLRFVVERVHADGPRLRPAYTFEGKKVPRQRKLRLPGYPGSPDVVIGNRASEQFQLDVFGEALQLFAAAAERDLLDGDGWRSVDIAADAIASRWQEPDAGIWETSPRQYAHSRLICAAGLRRVATVRGPGRQTGRWTALADRLLAEVARGCVHPSGRWQRAPDDERNDAALLSPSLRGLLPPDDPRVAATRASVLRELTEDGYVFRYSVGDEPLGVEEGAFLLTGYWLSRAMLDAGDVTTARALFERNRAACGPPGLFTEEYDVSQRQLRGNLPQAFVHAALLETAIALSDASD